MPASRSLPCSSTFVTILPSNHVEQLAFPKLYIIFLPGSSSIFYMNGPPLLWASEILPTFHLMRFHFIEFLIHLSCPQYPRHTLPSILCFTHYNLSRIYLFECSLWSGLISVFRYTMIIPTLALLQKVASIPIFTVPCQQYATPTSLHF